MQLKYGMNPNQDYAEVIAPENSFQVLNGRPSVINVLDALNSWQLVKEANECLGNKVSTSFKHVTPSGVGVGASLSEEEKQAYLVKIEPSELASS
ncbi:MAG: 5-aminoimidazole-4-carboxamide ribonucleotide transformylase, partial [Prolixibacteraceae bacterium]|nr:5-aminoimidazole-4-carboxamide ribonucleotide transformylase [Prolixibacteraceae bacterium]